MNNKHQKKAATAAAARHRVVPAGDIAEVSLSDLVAAYFNLDSKHPRKQIKQFRLEPLKDSDPGLGEVLLATLAASAPPMLRIAEDGKQRVVRNAETIFALASYTPSELWARTRVRCRLLSDLDVPGSTCEDLQAIFRFLAGTRNREIEDPARRGLRRIRLIHRERHCDVARALSAPGSRRQ